MTHAATRCTRAITPVAALCALLLLCVAMLWPASALASGVTVTPQNPVVGDTITATGSPVECENNDVPVFVFKLVNPSGTQTTMTNDTGDTAHVVVNQAGTNNVTEDAKCPNNTSYPVDHYFDAGGFTVRAGLSGTITSTPAQPVVNQSVTLLASGSGGNPSYTYAWDLEGNNNNFSDASGYQIQTSFTTTGQHTVRVKITDTATGTNASHTVIVSKTITVVASGSTTPPPPPPPCVTEVKFQLSDFTITPGSCFTVVSKNPNVWETTSTVKLNGVTLPGNGQTFTVTEPTASEPGGHFTALNSTIQLDNFTVFSGDIDWSLPAGGMGDLQTFHSFSVAAGSSLLGLSVEGSVAMELGEDTTHGYYAVFPLTIQLPTVFAAGPSPEFGSVSGAASLLVDSAGVHYDGLQLAAQNVWLGKLQVNSVCFSYIPPDGNTDACPTPTFGGTSGPPATPGGADQFVNCTTDTGTSRWDASADISLPSGLDIGAFGGLEDDKISQLGASVSGLGTRVPLANGFYLDSIALGLCLNPPPLIIRANVGVNFAGSSHLVNIEGGFTYTDGTQFSPWSLVLDGEVQVADTPIGKATIGINGNELVTFDVQAGVDVLNGVASLNAEVNGWIDAPNKQFLVAGDGKGCLGSACAEASGELSSTGIAGCVTVGSSLPSYNLIIPLDGGSPYLDTTPTNVTAGFGYDWGASSASLLGGTCDFSAFEPVLGSAARAAGANRPLNLTIAGGTQAISLRVHGTHGPPKLVFRGPHGLTVSSPAKGTDKLSKGRYLIVANKSDGTTDVMLIRPAAGRWTIGRAKGSPSSPTRIDRANLEVTPTFGARVSGRGRLRTLRVAYAVPPGTTVQLVERSKSIRHTIVANLRGRRCPGLPRLRPHTNEKILCTTLHFRPATGPGGKRAVQAVVTRKGIPLLVKNIASFQAAKLKLPSRIAALRIIRGTGILTADFSRSAGAASYVVSAKLSDGRQLAYTLGTRCHALRIANVAAGTTATIKIAGVRYDLAMGRSRSLRILGGATSAGRNSKLLKPGKVCS